MDLYTLDPNTFLQVNPIDVFQSVIWTERYNDAGDVTLVFPATSALSSQIVEGTMLYTPVSVDVMLIDTVTTKDGLTTATGQSLTAFLAQRMLRYAWQNTSDSHMMTGRAGDIAGSIVHDMCISGGLMSLNTIVPDGHLEVIPNLSLGTVADGVSISVAVSNGNVFDGVKTVADLDNIGFRMYPPSVTDGSGNLTFITYRGRDLTTDQTVYPAVIFGSALDTFTDAEEVRSIANYKTVAYVWASGDDITQASIVTVYATGANALTGWGRRSLEVDASDVNFDDYSATDLKAVLTQQGKDALVNNNYVRMTDGQLVPQGTYAYGVDYLLGDVIELRGPSGTSQQARITEYIRSQDTTGESSYPTLSAI